MSDAQRELEQRALRNVRGLVDLIEQEEADERRSQKRILLLLVAGAVVVGAVFVAVLIFTPPAPNRSLQFEVPRGAARPAP